MIEAMKLALEALYDSVSDNSEWIAKRENAVTSLRQAIEAAEKQEPVAWSYTNAQGRDVIIRGNVAPYEAPYEDATPLYTHPPKREWVGLTDEEIEAIGKDDKVLLAQFHTSVKGIDEMKDPTAQIMNLVIRQQGFNFAKAIDAKLREKNT